MAGVSKEAGFECVLMQGSGTFAVEGIVSSVIPPDGKLLVVSNGPPRPPTIPAGSPHHLVAASLLPYGWSAGGDRAEWLCGCWPGAYGLRMGSMAKIHGIEHDGDAPARPGTATLAHLTCNRDVCSCLTPGPCSDDSRRG